jgi:hypothetical protein
MMEGNVGGKVIARDRARLPQGRDLSFGDACSADNKKAGLNGARAAED